MVAAQGGSRPQPVVGEDDAGAVRDASGYDPVAPENEAIIRVVPDVLFVARWNSVAHGRSVPVARDRIVQEDLEGAAQVHGRRAGVRGGGEGVAREDVVRSEARRRNRQRPRPGRREFRIAYRDVGGTIQAQQFAGPGEGTGRDHPPPPVEGEWRRQQKSDVFQMKGVGPGGYRDAARPGK